MIASITQLIILKNFRIFVQRGLASSCSPAPWVLAEGWEGSLLASPTESHPGVEPGGDFHEARVVFSSFPVGSDAGWLPVSTGGHPRPGLLPACLPCEPRRHGQIPLTPVLVSPAGTLRALSGWGPGGQLLGVPWEAAGGPGAVTHWDGRFC